jgi:hypothetical protein
MIVLKKAISEQEQTEQVLALSKSGRAGVVFRTTGKKCTTPAAGRHRGPVFGGILV